MFLEDMGMSEPGLNRVIRAAYDLLGLQTYFSLPASKKYVLGPFTKATPLRRLRV